MLSAKNLRLATRQQPHIGVVCAAHGTGADAVRAESDVVPDSADGSPYLVRRLPNVHVVWVNAWQAPDGFGCFDNGREPTDTDGLPCEGST